MAMIRSPPQVSSVTEETISQNSNIISGFLGFVLPFPLKREGRECSRGSYYVVIPGDPAMPEGS